MPDMRYDLRISAHEIMGTPQVLVEVFGHPSAFTQNSERLFRRLYDVEDADPADVQRWVRDVLVAVAEHL